MSEDKSFRLSLSVSALNSSKSRRKSSISVYDRQKSSDPMFQTLFINETLLESRLRHEALLRLPPLIESITDKAKANRKYLKLFPNKVYTPWYRRYVNVLPDGLRIDFQPGYEIKKIDEDIALQYFFGEDTPLLDEPINKESGERRMAALRRYTKLQEMRDRAAQVKPEQKKLDKNTSLLSIIAANKSKAPDLKDQFGPTATERNKIAPILKYITKLQTLKMRSLKPVVKLPAHSKWRLFQAPIMKLRLKNYIQTTKQAAIRFRFRRVIQLVRCVYRFLHIISVISGDTKLILKSVAQFMQAQHKNTFLKFGGSHREGKTKIVFDAAKYKLSKRLPFSMEVKLTLTKPWFERSDEEITDVVKTLQMLRSFVEYPTSSQRRIAQVAWLIEVPADKVIIRECHIAQDFYIILRGKAKMTKLVGSAIIGERGEEKLIKWLKRDNVFGQESMSNPHSEREYTVYSTDHCDMLAVNIHDYLNMLMRTRDDEEAPEHIAFISSLDLLKDFPRAKLLEEGNENITLYYFRAGNVVTKSVMESPYIYVIKYGSARVIAERPPPQEVIDRYNEMIKSKVSLLSPNNESQAKMTLSGILPDDIISSLKLGSKRSSLRQLEVDHSKDLILTNPITQQKFDEHFKRQSTIQEKMKQDILEESRSFSLKSRKLTREPRIGDSPSRNVLAQSSQIFAALVEEDYAPSEVGSRRSVSFKIDVTPGQARNSEPTRRRSTIVGANMDYENLVSKVCPKNESNEADDGASLGSSQFSVEDAGSGVDNLQNVKKSVSSVKARARRQSIHMSEQYSTWRHIKRLVKGDYVGHEWLDFNNGVYEPPREDWSVVSEGSEVIMIKKEFLFQYMRKDW